MNKSQKHDGEREDIRTQLYEVLDRPHYHINMQKTATSIPYISAYMWNLEKMVQINLFPRQEQRCGYREQIHVVRKEKQCLKKKIMSEISPDLKKDITVIIQEV